MNIRRKRILIFSTIATIALITISTISYLTIINKKKMLNTISIQFKVTVGGAVKKSGEYNFSKPISIREVLFKSEVLTTADLTTLDLDKIIDNDYEIIVPYKVGSVKKIKWKDLNNVEQLTSLGVKKSIAQIIIDHRRQNETTTWERIHSLKGIGQVTLAQLKDLIDLS